jgi:hypothetical protein
MTEMVLEKVEEMVMAMVEQQEVEEPPVIMDMPGVDFINIVSHNLRVVEQLSEVPHIIFMVIGIYGMIQKKYKRVHMTMVVLVVMVVMVVMAREASPNSNHNQEIEEVVEVEDKQEVDKMDMVMEIP